MNRKIQHIHFGHQMVNQITKFQYQKLDLETMSLLDNFSDYTSMMSLGFLNSPKAANTLFTRDPQHRSPRHNSLLNKISLSLDKNEEDTSKNSRRNQQSRSIDKLMMPSLTSASDIKKKKLLKMSQHIRNKIRKIQFEFWVCLQYRVKERNKQKNTQKYQQGISRLLNFHQIYQARYINSFGLIKAFSSLKQISNCSNVLQKIENSIKGSINGKFSYCFRKISDLEATEIKIQMFANIISLSIFRKIQTEGFKQIIQYANKQDHNLVQNAKKTKSCKKNKEITSICASFQKISFQKDKTIKSKLIEQKQFIASFGEEEEKTSKIPLKQIEHKLIQSFSDQCDNSLIFHCNPFGDSAMTNSQSTQNLTQYEQNDFDQPIIYLTPREVQTSTKINERTSFEKNEKVRQITLNISQLLADKTNVMCRKKHSKSVFEDKQFLVEGQNFRFSEKNNKKHISSTRGIVSLSKNKQFDQERTHLQKKLFDKSNKQIEWKKDKKALKQIMASLRQTPRRQNKYYPLEDQIMDHQYLYCQQEQNPTNNHQSEKYNSKNEQKQRPENNHSIIGVEKQEVNYGQYKSSIKSKRLSVTSSLNEGAPIRRIQQNEEKKKNQKLIISLKNKRRESPTAQQIQKCFQMEEDIKDNKVRVFQPSDWKKLYLKQKQRAMKQK